MMEKQPRNVEMSRRVESDSRHFNQAQMLDAIQQSMKCRDVEAFS